MVVEEFPFDCGENYGIVNNIDQRENGRLQLLHTKSKGHDGHESV